MGCRSRASSRSRARCKRRQRSPKKAPGGCLRGRQNGIEPVPAAACDSEALANFDIQFVEPGTVRGRLETQHIAIAHIGSHSLECFVKITPCCKGEMRA